VGGMAAGSRVDVEYDRISLDKNGSEAGVESQSAENTEFAEELGIVFGDRYVDNDVSAYSGVERPEYLRLLADMEAGRVASVTVWHANRLHRNTEELPRFVRIARAHKVKLYSTCKGEAYNLEKASGRRQLRDDTSAAEYESEHRGERVAMARKRQARNGDWGGGVRAYGWGVDTGRVRSVCVNPKAPTMERRYEDRPVLDMTRHNVEEAAEIRGWKNDLLAGVEMRQVLRSMAARGVLTVSQKDQRTVKRGGRSVEHGGWDSRTVQQILTSPRTAGHTVYQGEILKRNVYEPIITEEERQALITLFADPRRKTSPGNTPKWLGSLIFRCGMCDDGSVMTVRYAAGVAVYRCRAKGHCQWPAEKLNDAVEELVIARLSRSDLVDLVRKDVPQLDVAALRSQLAVLETRKRDAAQRFARGTIEGDQLEEINAIVDSEAGPIRDALIKATEVNPLAEFAGCADARATWKALPLARKREVMRALVTITLPPIGRGGMFSPTLIKVSKPTPRTLRAAA